MNLSKQDVLEKFRIQKDSAVTYQERRHPAWTEIYTLYRDTPSINRLTQRQSVSIPLMKSAITTLLKDLEDAPPIYYENLDNDEQAEVFYNEYWNEVVVRNDSLVVKDIIDKKNGMLFGRTFKKLNIVNGRFHHSVVDPQNIKISRKVDTSDIDSARCLIETDIYSTISDLETTPKYDKSAIKNIKLYFESEEGLILANENREDFIAKQKRLADIGLEDAYDPKMGETFVELNEAYMMMYDELAGQDIFYLVTIAATPQENHILCIERLCDVLGETEDNFWFDHVPYTTWGVDIEGTDFWNDGIGDILRTASKILNSWISQLVENRTLRNFGMHFYKTKEGFNPQTWEPRAWGWYGTPEDPDKSIKNVEIPDLSESLDEIQFVMGVAEKAVAATATQQGSVEQSEVTLGEVKLALANARDRVKSMATSYNEAWKDFGLKYIKLLEGNAHLLEDIKITKRGRQSKKLYSRVVKAKDYMTKSGYRVDVKMVSDKQSDDIQRLQKLRLAKTEMADNTPLQEIYKKKLLQFCELTQDEMKEVMEFEKQKVMPNTMPGMPGTQVPNSMPNRLTPPNMPVDVPAMANTQI